MSWASFKDSVSRLKNILVTLMIRDAVKHTYGRGIYFGWKDKLLILLILASFFSAALFVIILFTSLS